MVLMLLWNPNAREGLCNGIKLLFEKVLDNKILQCSVMGSERKVLCQESSSFQNMESTHSNDREDNFG